MLSEPVRLSPELFVDIDRSGPIPLYFQLATIIQKAIADGVLPPGSRLENEVVLGDRLGISRPTVRRAIQEVVDKGLLVRRRGIGTQVVQRPVTRKVELTSLYDDLERDAKHPTTDVLIHEVVPASGDVADALSIPHGTEVLHLRRRRLTEGAPLGILENFLPLPAEAISREDLESRGLYQILRSRGVQVSIAQQRIGARAATTEESKLLDIGSHGPLLVMERTAFDSNGQSVEFGRHCYRPDLYWFQITVVNK